MPTTTRSKSKQTRLDDFVDEDKASLAKSSATAKASKAKVKDETSSPRKQKVDSKSQEKEATKPLAARKRKQPDGEDSSKNPAPKASPPPKKTQQQKISTSGDVTSPPELASEEGDKDNPVLINRAPVLHLWGACVAHCLHPSLAWPTCLAIGSQISTLCAISKGRSIGAIEPADPDKKAQKDEKKRKTADSADQEFDVMGFPMHVKNGELVVQGEAKKGNEGLLVGKFGNEQDYEKAKNAMTDALQGWKGKGDLLDKKAFGMYERFRPSVKSGQRGWGRKGELTVKQIREVVRG
ncbi:hypothetical protein LTR84_005502 [Exophiala bonariae]|uniref:Uncharacterized protein n=1 Tax=Exophiala bonariae TaxID=1690606 RepID=A0AAV9N682_9EURO|nr:hypothetical protein LTR84_005502 [Exophiala bonariae]